MDTVIVPERYCGPPGWGNGGFVAGLMAKALGGAVDVSLVAPTPLGRPLAFDRDADPATLRDGDTTIARATRRALDLEAPPAVSVAEAEAAMTRYAGFASHAFRGCFVCGPDRAVGDGLRIFAGPVEGRDLVAAVWTPGADLADAEGRVREEFFWAALDCPGFFAATDPGVMVLGRFHGQVTRTARAGETVIAMAWPIAENGRKFTAGSALYAADGVCLAVARATWVRLTDVSRFAAVQAAPA